ncbi:Zn(II)2Cys6 transcription factor domain-containing protein [Aspergillus affinis]|uniref:Zn(II)2Cys6 transcription factor domain-containing protein n=1 Tax=Aspergillus affinis TaxID=1070780 RepID=UPI0022FF3934|nr:uncharacterized protein KD926_005239 [Aspergillus affinis]KAI9042633.1 hypothetical protein KD926_005239 [Aspergillus affinis]
MGKRPSRQACIRCHGLKLRCDRNAAAKNCSRCLKAGVTCVFRLSTRGRQLVGNKSTPSPVHEDSAHEDPAPHSSTEDVSISGSPARDSEVTSDTCMNELLPGSPCQDFHDTSLDVDSVSSPVNPTALPANLPTDVASDCCSIGQTLGTNDGTGVGFPMNLTSPQFADSNVVAPKPSAQSQFRVQFMKDVLELDVELIQHTSVLLNPTEHGLLQVAANQTLTLAQQLLEIFHSAECWTSHTASLQLWGPYLYQPSIPSGSEQPETFLDQASTIHALSTYLRLVEAYQILFTRAIGNYNAVLANGWWNSLSSSHDQEFTLVGPSIQSALSIQSTVPMLDRLSFMVQLLTMPFIEVDVVRAVMATVREHERQLMQSVTQLQQIGSIW